MGSLVTKALALVLSAAMILPPGWCCRAGQVSCCAIAKAETPKSADSQKEPVCPHCKLAKKSTPSRSDTPAPAAPITKCCCERLPSQDNRAETLVSSDLAVAVPAVFESRPAVVLTLTAVPVVIDTSPPPHVLHCVWLC
jgi:hypothetical protein